MNGTRSGSGATSGPRPLTKNSSGLVAVQPFAPRGAAEHRIRAICEEALPIMNAGSAARSQRSVRESPPVFVCVRDDAVVVSDGTPSTRSWIITAPGA